MEKWNICTLLGGMEIGMENSMKDPQILKSRTTEYISKRNKISVSHRYISAPMINATLFTIAKTGKQPNCLPMNECIKNVICVYINKRVLHYIIK